MTYLTATALILDIDGVIRDVSGSYRRALADTVEHFTGFRPTMADIDTLKAEGIWNNDWEAAQELIRRYFREQGDTQVLPSFEEIVAFFQSRYRGTNWDGYITQEPLLVDRNYFSTLTGAGVWWGFFSGATRASARYVLQRLGLGEGIALVAMEDAPSKPDPTGLWLAIEQLGAEIETVIYAGDTVADMLTVSHARKQDIQRHYVPVGIVPPHVPKVRKPAYQDALRRSGAQLILDNVMTLTPQTIADII